MFANSAAAFKPLVEGGGVYAIHLFATRKATGETKADCRVNSEDFAEGAAALIAYAKAIRDYPGRGASGSNVIIRCRCGRGRLRRGG